jgi:hypothetical protein
MTLLPPAQAKEHLSHVAQQFAQWRHNRTTPRGYVPKLLWEQATACPWTRDREYEWESVAGKGMVHSYVNVRSRAWPARSGHAAHSRRWPFG